MGIPKSMPLPILSSDPLVPKKALLGVRRSRKMENDSQVSSNPDNNHAVTLLRGSIVGGIDPKNGNVVNGIA